MRIGIKSLYFCSLWKSTRVSRFEQFSNFSVFSPFITTVREAPSFHRPKSGSKSRPNERYLSSQHDAEPTIFALSTAPGRAAIAIIRISGPACLSVYDGICPGKPPPKPRYATLRTLWSPQSDPAQAQVLDADALVLYFPGPQTVTGEDVLELHIHGGPAVVKAVLDAIPKTISSKSSRFYPLRYAEPGEFTRRAFYNSRLNLTQVEALGDVLSAETEQQRRLAVRGASNGLAKEYESWRKNLILAQGELEALIDFSEDQHFEESPAALIKSVATQVEQLRIKLLTNIENSSRGELLRNGINLALLGAPNAGKSSLLNRIIGREAAIVSEEEGTTRDVVEVGVDLGGFYCRFGDLAGLREVSQSPGTPNIGEIEQEGMRRAKERAMAADVVLVIISSEDLSKPNAEVLATLKSCDMARQRIVYVINKSDLLRDHSEVEKLGSLFDAQPYPSNNSADTPVFIISCKEAQYPPKRASTDRQHPGGIEILLRGLVKVFLDMTSAVFPDGQVGSCDPSMWEQSLGASQRQRLLLQQCLQCLESFLVEACTPLGYQHGTNTREEREIDVVVAAETLRSAADCLAKLTGKGERGNVEEVLGVVFEKFCVGK